MKSLLMTEVESTATSMVTQEFIWFIQLMKDLYQPTSGVIQLCCDNRLAICFVENLMFHVRMKHIEAHYHLVREKELNGENKMI